MALNRGVFLDLGSVDNGDLDIKKLTRALPHWQWHEFTTTGECPGRIADANVAISNKCVLDRKTLSHGVALRLVVVAATGTDIIDLDAATDFDITVCNARDYATAAVSQHTITLILNLLSSQPGYRDLVRDGAWSRTKQFCLLDLPIRQAGGLNLGIIGHGVLGKRVAETARKLGMNVLIAERRGRSPGGSRLSFEDVVAYSDVISIHCPLTDETRNLFDRAMMQRMKRDAILINTARGGIVNEDALYDVLRNERIAGAAIDCFVGEPITKPHRFGEFDNVLLSPHSIAWTHELFRSNGRVAFQSMLDLSLGKRPQGSSIPSCSSETVSNKSGRDFA